MQVEQAEKYKLIVTAVRGEAGEGYVGIDDFHFEADAENCDIMPSEAAPTPTNAPTDSPTSSPNTFPECSFAETTCGWEVDDSQSLVWVRTKTSDLDEEGADYHPKEDHDGDKTLLKNILALNLMF